MKRILWLIWVMALFAPRLPAQISLEFFTNQANALLEPAFGFGIANIPVYSSTNPAIAYSASLHYLLQSAANAYDATTPGTNLPSVFRPLFSWQSNTLFIVGYTNVTTDFYTQTGQGFKALTDPTISSNDNVWGIPWVVGMKNKPPAFNEYCYLTAVLAESKLLFVRNGTLMQPITTLPPKYINQFFCMSISNLFGVAAWNWSGANFPDGVTIVASNEITITLTNNNNYGIYSNFSANTNWSVNAWPGWTGGRSDTNSFLIPILTNIISLPPSYWSDYNEQFVYFTNGNISSNGFLPSDMEQNGWPVYNWTLNITNNLMYGLIDNSSGQVLDFVNLGAVGNSLPITQVLADVQPSGLITGGYPEEWATNGATDAPDSPMSEGVSNQIAFGQQWSQIFSNDLNGLQPCDPGLIFGTPYNPSNIIFQLCTWQSVNPRVHYTLEDLLENDQVEVPYPPSLPTVLPLTNNLGILDLAHYNSGALKNFSFGLTNGTLQLDFYGANDLPYAIWASADMLNWSQIGTAVQLFPGLHPQPLSEPFQFNDLAATNYTARFYQVRLP